MKKLLLTLSICFVALSMAAQNTDESDIRKTFEEYFVVLKKKDNAALMEYMYPKFFTIVPKETMIQTLDQMYADTTMVIDYDSSKIISVSTVKVFDSVKYSEVDYAFVLTMEMKGEGRTAESLESILKTFSTVYGKENVYLNKATHTFFIKTLGKLLFVKDIDAKAWKLLEKKDDSMPILQMVIPEKVLEAFSK